MQNYNLEMKHTIAHIPRGTPLLLHACCAPCASTVIARLCSHFRLTVFFYNPNFDTAREYQRRQQAMQQLLQRMPPADWPVEVLYPQYDPRPFLQAAKGMEELPEGGARCTACFGLRLEETARVAAERGFKWMTTTLTLSPHKNPLRINEIGAAKAALHRVQFLPADFKKQDGFGESIRLSARYGLYRQEYCGCEFSRRPDGL